MNHYSTELHHLPVVEELMAAEDGRDKIPTNESQDRNRDEQRQSQIGAQLMGQSRL